MFGNAEANREARACKSHGPWKKYIINKHTFFFRHITQIVRTQTAHLSWNCVVHCKLPHIFRLHTHTIHHVILVMWVYAQMHTHPVHITLTHTHTHSTHTSFFFCSHVQRWREHGLKWEGGDHWQGVATWGRASLFIVCYLLILNNMSRNHSYFSWYLFFIVVLRYIALIFYY